MLRNLAIVAILTLSASVAMGDVLTFDDLPDAGSSLLPVPDGYGGLDWDEFYYMNASVSQPGSGYENCMVSAPHVAYNTFVRVATAGGSVFDFYLAYLGAAWNVDLNIQVEGYLGGIRTVRIVERIDDELTQMVRR